MPRCIYGSVMAKELVVELGHSSVMAEQCFPTKLKYKCTATSLLFWYRTMHRTPYIRLGTKWCWTHLLYVDITNNRRCTCNHNRVWHVECILVKLCRLLTGFCSDPTTGPVLVLGLPATHLGAFAKRPHVLNEWPTVIAMLLADSGFFYK